MSRLLFLLAVIIVVYLLLRSMRMQAPKREDSPIRLRKWCVARSAVFICQKVKAFSLEAIFIAVMRTVANIPQSNSDAG